MLSSKYIINVHIILRLLGEAERKREKEREKERTCTLLRARVASKRVYYQNRVPFRVQRCLSIPSWRTSSDESSASSQHAIPTDISESALWKINTVSTLFYYPLPLTRFPSTIRISREWYPADCVDTGTRLDQTSNGVVRRFGAMARIIIIGNHILVRVTKRQSRFW